MAKDINEKPFDEATQLKLKIFGETFQEWFPVFIHDNYTKKVYIYDFFSGSGTDIEGNFGSPLVLLDMAKGENRKYCSKVSKVISFTFNDSVKGKSSELQQNVNNHIAACQKNNRCGECVYKYQVKQSDFRSFFQDDAVQRILNNNEFGKFIPLDQYGFKEIDKRVFLQLISYPKTDFIFFISSSFIKRFKEHPNTKAHIDTSQIKFDESLPKECHGTIADYFKTLIPKDKLYYLHHFTIQKKTGKGNYYGLIFGTSHTLGMEKFLKVCWRNDRRSGESNCNIDNDYEEDTLFYDPLSSNKKDRVKKNIKNHILSGKIIDNISGLKFALQQGCEPVLFTEVVKELEKKKKIERYGELNYSSTNISKAKKYNIKVCGNENN